MSEYERLLRERRRTQDAKRDARVLKTTEPSVHPWVEAAQANRTREHTEEAVPAGGGSGPVWRIGALIVCLLVVGVTQFGTQRHSSGVVEGTPQRMKIVLWHALGTQESLLLQEYIQQHAAEESLIESVELVAHDDLEQALRVALLAGRAPDVAIVTARAAQAFAAAGAARPFSAESRENSAPFIPLGQPVPWTEPLVAIRLREQPTPSGERALKGYVTQLARYVEASLDL